VCDVVNQLDPVWHKRWVAKEVSPEELSRAANSLNNVIQEVQFEWRAIKPPGRTVGTFQPPVQRKRRLDDIGFPIDAGGFSGACGNIVCNKDCNICCKALRQFWREVCG
jgi:hypothetical protein